MKTRFSLAGLIFSAPTLCLLILPIYAPAGEPTGSSFSVVTQATPITISAATTQNYTQPRLPYGVDDVVKLSKAQVSEDVILTYVQNSGTIYSLGPREIVLLKESGVSDRVVNAMLDQRKKAAEAAPATATPAPVYTDNSYAATAPTYASPEASADSAPEQPAPSSVYVIPYPDKGPVYYRPYYSPYFGGFYGGYYGGYGNCYRGYASFGYPGISLGFGFHGSSHSYGHSGHSHHH